MLGIQSTMNPDVSKAFFRMLEENIGISLDTSKEYLLPSRLEPLARSHGFSGVSPFLESLLITPVGSNHWKAFEAMTTNETMFFRDGFPFEIMKKLVLPEIIQRKSASKELNIWCAASSSGQEPYSLAILLKDSFPDLLDWKVNFMATDICDVVLNRSKDAVYSEMEVRRGLNKEHIFKHFTLLPDGKYQLNLNIRQTIKFLKLNLVKEWPLMPKFDLVLLRNVLIYFNKDIKDLVLKKMHAQLSEDGIILLGTSESLLYEDAYVAKQYENLRFYKKG
jgi:chemotaxis protein methyltransferase CheR